MSNLHAASFESKIAICQFVKTCLCFLVTKLRGVFIFQVKTVPRAVKCKLHANFVLPRAFCLHVLRMYPETCNACGKDFAGLRQTCFLLNIFLDFLKKWFMGMIFMKSFHSIVKVVFIQNWKKFYSNCWTVVESCNLKNGQSRKMLLFFFCFILFDLLSAHFLLFLFVYFLLIVF